MAYRLRGAVGVLFAASMLALAAPSALAANFCPFGGKNYSVHATRCEDGKRLRCELGNTWVEVGACPAPSQSSGTNFCPHGGRNYTPHSTRCESGTRLRCEPGNVWKPVGSC